eukprot:g1159.t1
MSESYVHFHGEFRLTSRDNVEAFLCDLGMNWLARKAAHLALSATNTVTNLKLHNNRMFITVKTTMRQDKYDFVVGDSKPFYTKDLEGKSVPCHSTWARRGQSQSENGGELPVLSTSVKDTGSQRGWLQGTSVLRTKTTETGGFYFVVSRRLVVKNSVITNMVVTVQLFRAEDNKPQNGIVGALNAMTEHYEIANPVKVENCFKI